MTINAIGGQTRTVTVTKRGFLAPKTGTGEGSYRYQTGFCGMMAVGTDKDRYRYQTGFSDVRFRDKGGQITVTKRNRKVVWDRTP